MNKYLKENSQGLLLMLYVIIFNILIVYGQKIFFLSLSGDDIVSMNFNSSASVLSASDGRWFASILYATLFNGHLILPYLNSILGVISFTVAGALFNAFLKPRSTFVCILSMMLSSISIYLAYNLLFAVNISAWLMLPIGIYGFILSTHDKKLLKLTGFFLFVLSIGTYQSIIPVVFIIIIFKVLDLLIVEKKDFYLCFKFFIKSLLFILIALIVSSIIGYIYVHVEKMNLGSRFDTAVSAGSLKGYIFNIFLIYFKAFIYIKNNIFGAMATLIILVLCIRKYYILQNRYRNLQLYCLLLLMLLIPLFIFPTLILGVYSQPRALLSIPFMFAGAAIMNEKIVCNKIINMFINGLLLLSIVISIFSINHFFNKTSLSTSNNINIANQIVTRIRLNKGYTKEPVNFKIVGSYKLDKSVYPKEVRSALSQFWSKYFVFKNFTDFKFKLMKDNEYKLMLKYMKNNNIKHSIYPFKGSIFVYKKNVILFFSRTSPKNKIKGVQSTWFLNSDGN